MLIIGCDYHPSVQQIAWADTETGECGEKRLMHSNGEAERFYRELKQKGVQVRVGIEATGHSRWFERLLSELGFELWVGNTAEIRAARVRKQRNDQRDAKHILKLQDLEADSGESRRTATAIASSSISRDADTSDEPAAGHRHERRTATDEGPSARGRVCISSISSVLFSSF